VSEELEISPEAYDIAAQQVNDGVTYFRFSHYLARLNYIEPLIETSNGSIIVPRKMLASVAYGFAHDDNVFCIHLTGVLFDFFKQLFPIECMFVDDGENQGITVMMKPVKYADYSFPPLKMFFPIIAKRVYERGLSSSKTLSFTRIEQSLLNPSQYEILNVHDEYVKISTLSDFTNKDLAEENFMGMYS
jgi:hypothetical protein